jgi:hypothetical protein
LGDLLSTWEANRRKSASTNSNIKQSTHTDASTREHSNGIEPLQRTASALASDTVGGVGGVKATWLSEQDQEYERRLNVSIQAFATSLQVVGTLHQALATRSQTKRTQVHVRVVSDSPIELVAALGVLKPFVTDSLLTLPRTRTLDTTLRSTTAAFLHANHRDHVDSPRTALRHKSALLVRVTSPRY